MARREVLEVTCARCKRVGTQTKDEVNQSGGPEFEGSFWDTQKKRHIKVEWDDLCQNCRRAVGNYFNRIVRPSPDEIHASKDPSQIS